MIRNQSPRSHRSTSTQRMCAGAALLAAALASTSETHAAIQALDLGPSGFNLLGVNAGIAGSNFRTVSNFPVAGCQLEVYSRGSWGYSGLDGDSGGGNDLKFAVNAFSNASPRNFASGATIDGTALFSGYSSYTCFKYNSSVSANFNAGSFMGFRFTTDSGATFHYGWLEVLWDGTDWEILAGAYETTAGAAILAGAGGGGGGVPLPGAAGLAACGLIGLGRRRRR